MLFRTLVALLVAGMVGCYIPEVFTCEVDTRCVDGDVVGRCETRVALCSYPSTECESGRRYGPHAGDVAATCTPPPLETEPDYATCLGEGEPLDGPESCAGLNGFDRLDVDLSDSDTDAEARNAAFVSFAIPEERQLSGPTPLTLTLTAASGEESSSNASGTLWRVEPFTQETLTRGEPERLFPMLGKDLGPVAPGQALTWAFELDLEEVGDALHLAVFPTSENNVRYWNLLGDVPPRLVMQ